MARRIAFGTFPGALLSSIGWDYRCGMRIGYDSKRVRVPSGPLKSHQETDGSLLFRPSKMAAQLNK